MTRTCLLPVVTALTLFTVGLGAPLRADPVTYHVSVDMNVVSPGNIGQMGFLDFQFNPADSTMPFDAGTATVSNFNSNGGGITGEFFENGSVVGGPTFPATDLVIGNGPTTPNEATYNYTYGSSFSFDVTLAGPAVDNPMFPNNPSTFALTLFDSSGTSLTDPTGGGPGLTICTSGTCGIFAAPGITVTSSLLPEPSSWAIFGVALLGLGGYGWRRRRALSAR
jgi:hypothetical protein